MSPTIPGVSELVDREAELAVLEALIAEAVSGRGGAALVEGESGIGKTRLLAHARAEAAARGRGSCTRRPTRSTRACRWPSHACCSAGRPAACRPTARRGWRCSHWAERWRSRADRARVPTKWCMRCGG